MKKVLLPLSAIVIALSLIVVSCSKSSEDNLGGGNGGGNGGGGTTCDTANMTYSANVAPIISANCTGCHSGSAPSGGVTLSTYAGVKTQADNGNLVGVITHASGYPAMPQGGSKLSDCNINKIKAWIARGALNN